MSFRGPRRMTGWETIFELDLKAQPNQDLVPGGDVAKTIDGKSLIVFGTADASAYSTINGTGMRHTLATNGVAYLGWVLNVACESRLTDFGATSIWEATVIQTSDALVQATESLTPVYFYDDTAARFATRVQYLGAANNNLQYETNPQAAPPTTGSTAISPTTRNDVIQLITQQTHCEAKSAVNAAGWEGNLVSRGTRTNGATVWFPSGNDFRVWGIYQSAAGCVGRNITYEYIRIRRRTVGGS